MSGHGLPVSPRPHRIAAHHIASLRRASLRVASLTHRSPKRSIGHFIPTQAFALKVGKLQVNAPRIRAPHCEATLRSVSPRAASPCDAHPSLSINDQDRTHNPYGVKPWKTFLISYNRLGSMFTLLEKAIFIQLTKSTMPIDY